MAKKRTFLKLLKEWAEAGELPYNGLCNSFFMHPLTDAELEIFRNFEPTNTDYEELRDEGLTIVYWASGTSIDGAWLSDGVERRYGVTPLRQTLLCFCAALNNEL